VFTYVQGEGGALLLLWEEEKLIHIDSMYGEWT